MVVRWRKRVVKDSKSVLLTKVDQEQIIPDVPSFIPGKVVHIVLENNRLVLSEIIHTTYGVCIISGIIYHEYT